MSSSDSSCNPDVSLHSRRCRPGHGSPCTGYHGVEELTSGDQGDVFYDPAPQGLIVELDSSEAVNVWGEDGGDAWSGVDTIRELRAGTVRSTGAGVSGCTRPTRPTPTASAWLSTAPTTTRLRLWCRSSGKSWPSTHAVGAADGRRAGAAAAAGC